MSIDDAFFKTRISSDNSSNVSQNKTESTQQNIGIKKDCNDVKVKDNVGLRVTDKDIVSKNTTVEVNQKNFIGDKVNGGIKDAHVDNAVNEVDIDDEVEITGFKEDATKDVSTADLFEDDNKSDDIRNDNINQVINFLNN